ncbi:MAG: peptidoglycan DD-metalloendopeptidase family protein [Rikenellaceae bacterium]
MKRLLLLITFILCSASCFSQSIETLKDEILKAEQEIERSKKMLFANKDEQKNGLTQLQLIRSNIKNRKLIVANLDKQVSITKKNISGNNKTIAKLSDELVNLKKDYAVSIKNGYKDYKQNNYLLFIFSAATFYDMHLRSKYLERVASLAQVKSQNIANSQKQIGQKNETLKEQQAEIKKLLASRNKELASLAADEAHSNKILSSLKSQEDNINSTIKQKNQQISKLQDKIQKIIEEEALRQQGKSTANKEIDLKLSNNFADNKGKFPAPVLGVVTSGFGMQPHPTQKNVKVKNNGINITTSQNTVKSIFEGEVVKIFFFQGLNSSIMVRHGNYISVYSNLTDVDVKVGDTIKTGQKLGSMTKGDTDLVFHFELWKETTPLDPEQWLKL